MPPARVSRTAKKIARFVLLIDANPRLAGLLPAGAAAATEAILRASGAVRPAAIDMMRAPWALRFAETAEAWTGRGQILWFGLRKRWFADAAEAAVAAGAEQLLVVGAGLDPLAALVAGRRPGVLCVEIDAPATAEAKRAGVAGAGLAAENLHIHGADLASQPLAEALRATPWRFGARSVVAAEGLLMYLDRAAVLAFLAAARACAGPGGRLALSSMDADDRGRPRLSAVGPLERPLQLALRLAGEPLRWGIPPGDLPQLARETGYRLLDQPDLAALRARYLAPLGLGEEPASPYEHLALAEVDPSLPAP